MTKSRLFILIAFSLFCISFVYAGCCYESDTGFCTDVQNSNTCTSTGGFFYSSSCDATSDCTLGCCNYGLTFQYTTKLTCSIYARAAGFQYGFQQGDANACYQASNSQSLGACVFGSDYQKYCTSTTQQFCQGQFYAGALCSSTQIGLCNTTTNSKCINGNAYYVDSCGNQGTLKETCNYNNGTICAINNQTNEAYCRSLNCDNGMKNGESKCINEDPTLVGSRSFVQYCLNGKVNLEPCAEYRSESCVTNNTGTTNNAYCETNPWSSCVTDGNDLGEIQQGNQQGYLNNSVVVNDSCDPQYCNVFSPASNDTLLNDMKLNMCVPKVPGGLQFWPQTGMITSPAKDLCDYGSYTGKAVVMESSSCTNIVDGYRSVLFFSGVGLPFLILGDLFGKKCTYNWGIPYETVSPVYSGAAIISADVSQWETGNWHGLRLCNSGNPDCSLGASSKSITPSQDIINFLSERCASLGDCGSKYNLEEIQSGNVKYNTPIYPSVSKTAKTYTINFKCIPFSAQNTSADCTKCGQDGMPCTEYRCKSYGKSCDFHQPDGIDTGFCVPSTDFTPPVITSTQSPQNPVPPFSSVSINLSTNEPAECRFALDASSYDLESLPYSFDGDWTTQHKVTLNVPGKVPTDNSTGYNLITNDGSMNVFVYCGDAAGNVNYAPYLITLNIMQTPDNIPPAIISANPSSGSKIMFNTTDKIVDLVLDEPAECKWSSNSLDNYDSMPNNFSCDTSVNPDTVVNGYHCLGDLTNVTEVLGSSTSFYINCKDQPWLEGNETTLYHRNTMLSNQVYTLSPSDELVFSEVTPSGYYTVGSDTQNWTLTANTVNGSDNGVAVCQWRISQPGQNMSYSYFENTNSSTSTQIISNKPGGNYLVEVVCTDEVGNVVNMSANLNLRIDMIAPIIARVYNDKGSLKIITSEGAICKAEKDVDPDTGCFYDFGSNNAILFYTTGTNNTVQSIPATKYASYYVKCQDAFKNGGNDCAIVGKIV